MTNLGPSLRHVTAGNEADFMLGIEGHGWHAFDVVRFHGVEAISQPFRFDITLARAADQGPMPLEPLLNLSATLSIAAEGRWRLVHGILSDVERLEHTGTLILYRARLVPHLFRAQLRRRCRVFVDRTLRDILTTVLENRARPDTPGSGGLTQLSEEGRAPGRVSFDTYAAPAAHYRWAVSDETRLRDPLLRSYAVQYNESDLAFLSRLLEEEGLSYFFEVAEQGAVMTITDRPGHMPLCDYDATYSLRTGVMGGGADVRHEVIQGFGERAAMAPHTVTMRDFAWPRSRVTLEARADGTSAGDADHFEYPARDEGVASDPCRVPAHVVMERFEVERRLTSGVGTVRTMTPGYRFRIDDPHATGEAQELLADSVETFATQLQPESAVLAAQAFPIPSTGVGYRSHFRALPASQQYRPARVTPRPRIDGVQTALVSAEEHASPPEINADRHARVRVRFPWDQTPATGQPTSMWIRVSHAWAGGAFGGLYHPRVGHEVVVAYLQGDPERPMIVGRVYNVQTPPPYDGSSQPTLSTVKSQSSPNAQGSNELRFEDEAGQEEVYLHAQRDLNEVIERDHTAKVGRNHRVDVERRQTINVGASRSLSVGGSRSATIGENDTITVRRGDREVEVVSGDMTIRAENGKIHLTTGPAFIEMEDDKIELNSGRGARVRIGGNVIHVDASQIRLQTPQGARVELNQPDVIVTAGANITAMANEITELGGQRVVVTASDDVDVHGNPIKLNC